MMRDSAADFSPYSREDDASLPEEAALEYTEMPPGRRREGHEKTKRARSLVVEAADLTAGKESDSPVYCETYVYDPDLEEKGLGSLYMAFETIRASERVQDVLDSVATAIRKEYYREPDRGAFESLEAALDQANHVLAELFEQGEPDWSDNFHAAVCTVNGTTLHISRVGRGELLLARKKHFTDIGQGLSDPRTRRPLHPFTNIATGIASEDDVLVLATPELLHLIPRERLHHMLMSHAPNEVVQLLRSLLDDAREAAAFAALILHFSRAPERLPAPEVPVTLPPRVRVGEPRERETEQPTIRPRRPIQTKRTFIETVLHVVKRGALLAWIALTQKAVPALVQGLRWITRYSISKARSVSQKTTSAVLGWSTQRKERQLSQEEEHMSEYVTQTEEQEARSSVLSSIVLRGKDFVISAPASLKNNFGSSSKSVKAFLAIIGVLVVAIILLVVGLSRKHKEDAAIQVALSHLQEAQTNKTSAEAALIVENSGKAHEYLKNAHAALEAVAQTKYYANDVTSLNAQLQGIEDSLEKRTRVEDPKVIGDFAKVSPNLNSPSMVAIGDGVFTFDPTNNAIYRMNVTNGETATVSQTSQGIGYFRAATPLLADKTILFSTDSPGLALFDTDRKELIKQDIKLPDGVKNITALGTFGNRLYILAPEKKMIYGYSKTLAGYDGGAPWLTNTKVPVENALTMGIDGYIYLLTKDGTIVKLLKGAPVDFTPSALATPMKNPTRLLANENYKNLYILDPENNRVLMYNSGTGQLLKQFVFPDGAHLKDIAVGGKEDTLYVLNGTQVISLPLKETASPSPLPAQ